MTMVKDPPITTYPDDAPLPSDDEYYRLQLDDKERLVLTIKKGRVRLQHKMDRVDVIVQGNIRTMDICTACMNDMRGFRSILAHRDILRAYHYPFMQGDWNQHFCMSLAPGDYRIDTLDDGGQHLWWHDDVGTQPVDKPRHEPDYAHMLVVETPGIKRRPMPPIAPQPDLPQEPEPLPAPSASLPRRTMSLRRRPIR